MTSILCVHQGTEKYGSDKSFVGAVAALQKEPMYAPKILLPSQGSIFSLVEDAGLDEPETRHLWILRKADFVKAVTLGLPRNIGAVLKAMRDLKRHDITYVNTAVILDFLLASILTRREIIVHVREIPVGIAMKVIRRLLILAKAKVIFNSQATADAFDLPADQPQSVVYNGFEVPAVEENAEPAAKTDTLNVLCIGRLNSWKGQEVLVRACALLTEEQRQRIAVRIVGGVYKDQTHFRTNLEDEIATSGLQSTIEMQDFVDDPAQEYRDAAVVVVPSTLPEPFGRVAIEGMAYQGAVIATDHGGLKEIVVDGETGVLVAPNDPQALAQALVGYLQNPDMLSQHQKAGYQRFVDVFTQDACDATLLKAFAL